MASKKKKTKVKNRRTASKTKAPKKLAKKSRKHRNCSVCGIAGHNKRTCRA